VTGHIKVVFSRGIRKVGFELSGTFIFDEEELKVEEATDYGDLEYITTKKAQVSLQAEGFNDDFDQVNFMYSVYPKNGIYAEIANDL
jgi:hypothetical protein